MRLRREAIVFQRIYPEQLNGRQKEIYNFQKSAALLADYGFNCIKLADDWRGADFLAHHFDGKTTLKVQLKARLTVDRKYADQELWINFPVRGTWYLVPHDRLVEMVKQTTNWLNTSSWLEHGSYSSANPGPKLLEQLHPFLMGPDHEPAHAEPPPGQESDAASAGTGDSSRDAQAHSQERITGWRHQNIQMAADALERVGYVCTAPAERSRHVDMLARPQRATESVAVRCPGRVAIYKDWENRGIHVCFPDHQGVWYLVPHDELVEVVGRNAPWLESDSWRLRGGYSARFPSGRLRSALRNYALNATAP